MNNSCQAVLSVGTSALPEAPLILDSPSHKQDQIVQPQTGWVVLPEVPRTWPSMSACCRTWSDRLTEHPGRCRAGDGGANMPSLRGFGTGMTSLFPQSFLNQWHQFLSICPKNMCEWDSLLFRLNFYLQFVHELYFLKRYWVLPKILGLN